MQPADADANLAKALTEMNRDDKAIPLFEDAMRLDPAHPIARNRLSTLYRKMGRMDAPGREVRLYQQYKDRKERLRAVGKDLLIQPGEFCADDVDDK